MNIFQKPLISNKEVVESPPNPTMDVIQNHFNPTM